MTETKALLHKNLPTFLSIPTISTMKPINENKTICLQLFSARNIVVVVTMLGHEYLQNICTPNLQQNALITSIFFPTKPR